MKTNQMKKFVKGIFRAMGLYVKPLHHIPFGVEWWEDLKYLLDGKNLELVVDVGANTGQTVYEVLKFFPKSCIYCFEPFPATFKRLSEETSALSNVLLYNIALGDRASTLPMITKSLSGQNTLVFDGEQARNNDTELVDVEINTLDQFCLTNNINKISLLKVDTEGYEIQVLRGAEQMLSTDCIDYILVECDFLERSNEPHGNFVQILNYLKSFQYNVVSFYTCGVDNLGWKWGDVLFCKISNDESGFAISPFGKKFR